MLLNDNICLCDILSFSTKNSITLFTTTISIAMFAHIDFFPTILPTPLIPAKIASTELRLHIFLLPFVDIHYPLL